MHAVLYVCLPRSQARTSLAARKKVCEYLVEEGFDTLARFSGHCDYFGVGGYWSGRLNLLRLRQEHPKQFARFWKRFNAEPVDGEEQLDAKEANHLFRECFPSYRGKLPFNREDNEFYGEADDAQIMDKPLFQQLKGGFSEKVTYAYEIEEPNVICTEDDDEFEWPKTIKQASKLWVVVIDYHH